MTLMKMKGRRRNPEKVLMVIGKDWK